MNRSSNTLNNLLKEIKTTIPAFKVGQIFETTKSIYPDVKIPKSKKNIVYKDTFFTKPLASDRKSKERFLKEESPLSDFFKNINKGDFLQVVKVENKKAYCVNLSLKEDVREKYYKDEFVVLDYLAIVNGIVKPFKRKSIEKYFND